MQPQLKYRGIPIATQHRCVSPLGVIVAVDGTRGAKIRGAVASNGDGRRDGQAPSALVQPYLSKLRTERKRLRPMGD